MFSNFLLDERWYRWFKFRDSMPEVSWLTIKQSTSSEALVASGPDFRLNPQRPQRLAQYLLKYTSFCVDSWRLSNFRVTERFREVMFTKVIKQEETRTRESTNKQEDNSSVLKCRDSNNFCKLTYWFIRFFDFECVKKLSCLFALLRFWLPSDACDSPSQFSWSFYLYTKTNNKSRSERVNVSETLHYWILISWQEGRLSQTSSRRRRCVCRVVLSILSSTPTHRKGRASGRESQHPTSRVR